MVAQVYEVFNISTFNVPVKRTLTWNTIFLCANIRQRNNLHVLFHLLITLKICHVTWTTLDNIPPNLYHGLCVCANFSMFKYLVKTFEMLHQICSPYSTTQRNPWHFHAVKGSHQQNVIIQNQNDLKTCS